MNVDKFDDLPRGWSLATIDDLVSRNGVFKDGDWVESKDQDPNGNVRLIQLADIGDGDFKNKSSRFLTDVKAKELNCTFLERGDVLVARMPDPLGRACLFPLSGEKRFVTVVDVCVVRFGHEFIIPSFLVYLINSPDIRKSIEEYKSGSTRKRISRKNFAKIEFPIPPLNEQRRIVAKIEALFSELEAGVAALERAAAQLKTYRQSLLKHAFEGKLTAEWRAENQDRLETAETLLQRIKAERQARYEAELVEWQANGRNGRKPRPPKELPPLTPSDVATLPQLPPTWARVKTGQVIDPINNGYTPTSEYLSQDEGEIPFVKVYNLNFDGSFNFSKNPTFIPKHIHQQDLQRSICKPGDVLINIVGPPLGKVSVLTNQYPEWNINQAIVLFRPNKFICSEFISLFMQEPNTIRWLESTSKATAGQFNVKVSTCREIPIPLVGLEEQKQIVVELESRLSVVEQLEQTIRTALQQSEALRQSILKKAFAGQLVPQDPSDEPAAALLARIRAGTT